MQRKNLCGAAVAMAFVGFMNLPQKALADVTASIAEPKMATILATPGKGIRFDLVLLNDSDAPEQYVAPPTVAVRVTTINGTYDAPATRADGRGDAETISLPASGFVRVGYVIDHRSEGATTVTLADGSTAATVLRSPDVRAAATAPVTAPRGPLEAIVSHDPNYKSELGLVEYLANRIKPHEPVYIIAGDEDVTTKFQFSFKYQILNPEGAIAQKAPPLAGIYFAYSQTSLWDLGEDSSPFFDSVYRPELLLSYEDLDRFAVTPSGNRMLPEWVSLAGQAGYRHESNGRSGDESRSINTLYVRPIMTFRGDDDLFLTLAPTLFTYVADLSDNPDIRDYRGHAELRVVAGQGGGVQLATTGRLGEAGGHGSLEFDLTVPIRKLTLGNFDVYFHTQYFMGDGETLLTYDESTYALRFGVALVR